ncbi:hypothetical protein Pyrfu_0277 [Pyrolobus fumarii 1A]|uniref:Zn-dependent hydrolase of the beta-lactamase fold-like protein n=1 Tax=Pyrolobus fumarii (strain DSM 11204 / 1A) TaxID=694429 RepID=G0EFA6_PYRF1|nr:MBL fold metallo-hydrolase [Pyrolobus fumarii]AEM38149.1 hypothetical protein Pyrfu_0277 [Pyrolobus fumarii 1A]
MVWKLAVIVRWWGHACIELVYDDTRLMIDPHDGASIGVGVKPPKPNPHYILVTHRHFDHNAVDVVKGDSTREVVVERTGEFSLGPFRVKGVKLPHDEFGGRYRGFVVAYRIEVDGITFTHLGDAGIVPGEEEAKQLRADIVFVPAGGVYTMHPREAAEVLDMLEAKVGVPIHYWLRGYFLPLDPLDEFLSVVRKRRRVVRLENNEFSVSRDELPSEPSVYVLEAPWLIRG